MRSLFIADPLEGLDPTHDSTVAMIEAAQRAGHEVWATTMVDLTIGESGASGHCVPIQVDPATLTGTSWVASKDWLSVGPEESIPLREFSTISVRTDPPVNDQYLRGTYLLDHVDPKHTVVINRPSGLRNANEKLYAINFRHLMPETIVSARKNELIAFARDVGTAVVKPTDGLGGRGIMLLDVDDPNALSILDTLTSLGRRQVMLQRFVPEVEAGDRRVIVIDGEPRGVIARLASGDDFRCNMATGATVRADEVDDDIARITGVMGERLRSDGLWFVGLDVIGGTLTEVNVTSPTGLREIQALCGLDVAEQYIAFTEELVDRKGGR